MSHFFKSLPLNRSGITAHSPEIFGKQETEWMCRLPTTAEMKVIMRGEGGGEMLSQAYGV